MTLSVGLLAFRYSAFAAIATVVNIVMQEVSLAVHRDEYSLAISILIGTGAGFLVKYILDKYFIFFDRTTHMSTVLWRLTLYGFSGVLTTLVFWVTEIGFWHIWNTEAAKYTGAVLGLTMGYVIKYLLDRRFVFVQASPT